MPRAIVTGDWHMESGLTLGQVDPEYGSTRLRDARRVLERICAEPADLMVFAGDFAGRKVPYRPSATSYRIAQEVLAQARADRLLALMGNHDWTGEHGTALDVIAGVVPKFRIARQPGLSVAGGIQVGVLPWTPPARLFAQAPHSPRELHRLVASKLMDAVRGMGARLDPARPSMLVGHWAMMTGAGEGADVVKNTEVVLDVDELAASGPWDVVAFGHYHEWEVLRAPAIPGQGPVVCHIGPPMRGGFGEADLEPGYLVIEWADEEQYPVAHVEHVPTPDRKLVTARLDGDLRAEEVGDVTDAIVKPVIRCTPEQAHALRAQDGRALKAIVERLRSAGAERVFEPVLKVDRAERERRSDLTVDVDPLHALDTWLELNEIPASEREPVREIAGRVMRDAA